PALERTGEGLRRLGEVHVVPANVADARAVDALRDRAVGICGTVHVVVNNAGVAAGGPSWTIPLETWRWILDVNVFGVVHGIRSFVPLLVDQGEGHVVNVASAAGLVSARGLAPYSASKHAVVAISEALLHDLALAGSPVGMTAVCPAFVRTQIHEAARNAPPDVLATWLEDETTCATWE